MTIVWMRHGESTWNVSGRLQGHTAHPPLTDRGRAQVEAAVEELRGLGLARVLTSPAVRARQSAEIVATALTLPLHEDDRLIEQGLDEPAEAVVDRLRAFIAEHSSAPVLAVSHGDAIPLAYALQTGASLAGPLPNAAIVTTG